MTAGIRGGSATKLPQLTRAEQTRLQSNFSIDGLRWAFAQSDSPWALVTLVDVPAVRVSTVKALLAGTHDDRWRAIRPVNGGRHGHPVIWRRDVLPLLEGADATQGAKTVMRALAAAGAVVDVDVDDEGVFRDIDTPDDYARLTNPPAQ